MILSALIPVLINSINSVLAQTIVDELLAGAVDGVIAGLIVGALVWPIMQAPDALGRVILFGIIGGLIMLLYQAARISVVTGSSLGSIINAFNTNTELGNMIFQGGIWVLVTMLAAAVIGALSLVPGEVLKGGLAGLFIGALIGALLGLGLQELDVSLNLTIFRVAVGLLTWGVFTAVSG